MKVTEFYLKVERVVINKKGEQEILGLTSHCILDPLDDFEECRDKQLRSTREFIFENTPKTDDNIVIDNHLLTKNKEEVIDKYESKKVEEPRQNKKSVFDDF